MVSTWVCYAFHSLKNKNFTMSVRHTERVLRWRAFQNLPQEKKKILNHKCHFHATSENVHCALHITLLRTEFWTDILSLDFNWDEKEKWNSVHTNTNISGRHSHGQNKKKRVSFAYESIRIRTHHNSHARCDMVVYCIHILPICTRIPRIRCCYYICSISHWGLRYSVTITSLSRSEIEKMVDSRKHYISHAFISSSRQH